MKEITRIHIAKIAYDAELEAKKKLEVYLKSLEAYSEDTDILDDIEIRMTEILAERGVKSGGVVTIKDIKAIKEQLGEPRDFMGDGDMAVGPEDGTELSTDSSRKLFRDTDHAVLGGVLSGIAAFFKVSPVMIRILFIIIALASFGTALLVYVVLWIAVPPAKTATDKLQMAGRPVNVSSIRQMNEEMIQSGTVAPANGNAGRILLVFLGVFCLLGALGALLLTVVITSAVIFGHYGNYFQMGDGAGFFVAAFCLALVSGMLLTILFSLGAYASFTMRASKRVIISMSVVTVLGMIAFATAVGLAQYASLRYDNAIKSNIKEVSLAMPQGAGMMKRIHVEAPDTQVQYIVTTDTPKVTIRTLSNRDVNKDVKLEMEGTTLKLKGQSKTPSCKVFWCEGLFITMYGPALEQMTVEKKSDVDYAGETQTQLTTVVNEGAEVVVSSGTFDTFAITAKRGTEFAASAANVSHVDATLDVEANLELGRVRSMKLDIPASCTANKAHVETVDITADSLLINNQSYPVKEVSLACATIVIEGRDE